MLSFDDVTGVLKRQRFESCKTEITVKRKTKDKRWYKMPMDLFLPMAKADGGLITARRKTQNKTRVSVMEV